jgi:hypothetical protein
MNKTSMVKSVLCKIEETGSLDYFFKIDVGQILSLSDAINYEEEKRRSAYLLEKAKQLGWIVSKRLSPTDCRPEGATHYWRITDAGRAALKEA